MPAIAFSTTLRTSRAQAIVNALDGGAGAGKFLLYTSPRPASGAAITTQTLLGTCVLSDPCGTVAAGVTTFAAISDDAVADASGNIVWVRGVDSTGAWVMDLSAGVSGSDAQVIFNTVAVLAGGVIQILSGVLTEGNA